MFKSTRKAIRKEKRDAKRQRNLQHWELRRQSAKPKRRSHHHNHHDFQRWDVPPAVAKVPAKEEVKKKVSKASKRKNARRLKKRTTQETATLKKDDTSNEAAEAAASEVEEPTEDPTLRVNANDGDNEVIVSAARVEEKIDETLENVANEAISGPTAISRAPEEVPLPPKLMVSVRSVLNKLSEANFVALVPSLQKLFDSGIPRNTCTRAVTQGFLESACPRNLRLNDVVIYTYAALAKALQAMIGSDVVAALLRKMCVLLNDGLATVCGDASSSDLPSRLPALSDLHAIHNQLKCLGAMFVMRVVDSTLMYEVSEVLVKACPPPLREVQLELLLVHLQSCGMQLRQENPAALTSLVELVRAGQAKSKSTESSQDEEQVSARQRILVDFIVDLQRKKRVSKSQVDPHATYVVPYTRRIRTILTSVGGKGSSVSIPTPLSVNWETLVSQSRKRTGYWWWVRETSSSGGQVAAGQTESTSVATLEVGEHFERNGAEEEGKRSEDTVTVEGKTESCTLTGEPKSEKEDLALLAKQQNLYSHLQKSILAILATSVNYIDCFERLVRLNLRKHASEIFQVVVQCCVQEVDFNPFYPTLLLKLCQSTTSRTHKTTYALQCSLWAQVRVVCGTALVVQRAVNLAELIRVLLEKGGLTIEVLKPLDVHQWEGFSKRTLLFCRLLLLYLLHIEPTSALVQVFFHLPQKGDNTALALGSALQQFYQAQFVNSEVADTFVPNLLLTRAPNLPALTPEEVRRRAKIVIKTLNPIPEA